MIEFQHGRTVTRRRPVRVLVTADGPDAAQRLSAALQQAGAEPCEVCESHRAFEIQERLARGDVEAVVVEVSFQGQPVSSLVSWLSTVAPDVPVVLIARDARPDDVMRALADGVEEVVTAELDGDEIAEAVRAAVARHISRRRQGRSVAREAESRYRYLFEHNPNPMWVYNVETLQFLAVNDAAVWQYGFSRDEFMAMTVKDIRPHEDVPLLLERLSHVSASRESHRGRWRHRRKDGTIVHVQVVTSPIVFDGQRAELVVAYDVTDEVAVQQALESSERRYREIVENAIDLIFTTDLDLRVTSVNSAAVRILGFSREDMVGRSVFGLIPRQDRERVKDTLRQLLGTGTLVSFGLPLLGRDGQPIDLEVSAWLVRDGETPVGVQGIARDLSERRLLEAQLRQSQKMEAIGQLAGGIAHDFSNHLTVIAGYARTLAARLPEPGPILDDVTEIRRAAERAAAVTRQLLSFGRRQVLQPVVLDPTTVVRDLESMLRRLIGEHIELVTILDAAAGRVKADRNQIEHVLLNLAVNARDAMPRGGRLTIEVRDVDLETCQGGESPTGKSSAFVRLTVADTGVGMDPDTQRRIFEPFFTTKAQGSGLGLSTVYGIVQQSGGRIGVSSARGQGTTFRLYFPRVEAVAVAAEDDTRDVTAHAGAERILLVEDDLGVREFVRTVLARAGYTVYEAAHPEEALTIANREAGRIDLLLSDLVLPACSGTDLAGRIRAVTPDLRVLFMTGYADDSPARQSTLDPAPAVLEKPFEMRTLLDAVRGTLDR